jgi:acyl-CoA thioesterase
MDSPARLDFFENDRFAVQNGIRPVEIRPGYGRAELIVGPDHFNAVGVVQGGAVFTLADLAFAMACNSHAGAGVAVSCQSDITQFKAVRSGTLTAVAEEISRTRKLSTCVVRVTDDTGELVALFKGVAYIKETRK